jgi:hypothetical protein
VTNSIGQSTVTLQWPSGVDPATEPFRPGGGTVTIQGASSAFAASMVPGALVSFTIEDVPE